MSIVLTSRLTILAIVVVLFSPGVFGESAEPATPLSSPEDLELIRTLVKHNLANYEKIKSYRTEFETSSGGKFDTPQPKDKAGTEDRSTGRGKYLRKGDWYRFEFRSGFEIPNQGFSQETLRMAVLNNAQYGEAWVKDNSVNVICYDHFSLAERTDSEIKLAGDSQPPHPLLHGFARGYPYNITDRMEKWADLTKWTVAEEVTEGVHLYLVAFNFKDTERKTVTFDANKGYLITSVQTDDTRGKQLLDVKIVPAQFGDVWVPQQVDEIDRQNGRFFHLRATATDINITLTESEFQMDRLEFDREKAKMTRYEAGIAKPTLMVFREGEWVPGKA